MLNYKGSSLVERKERQIKQRISFGNNKQHIRLKGQRVNHKICHGDHISPDVPSYFDLEAIAYSRP
jgi:UDP-2,3-diacylglucosamine pyrophosphatase LpxH